MCTSDPMPHTRLFTGTRPNWSQHVLRNGAADNTALVCIPEGDPRPGSSPAVSCAGRMFVPGTAGGCLPAEHRTCRHRLLGRRIGRRGVGMLFPGLLGRGHHRSYHPTRSDGADCQRTDVTGTARMSTAVTSSRGCASSFRRCAMSFTSGIHDGQFDHRPVPFVNTLLSVVRTVCAIAAEVAGSPMPVQNEFSNCRRRRPYAKALSTSTTCSGEGIAAISSLTRVAARRDDWSSMTRATAAPIPSRLLPVGPRLIPAPACAQPAALRN